MSSRSPKPRSWRNEESPLRALLQVLAIGLLMAAGVFFWVRYAKDRSERATVRVEAQTQLRSGAAGALRAAASQLEVLLRDTPDDAEARMLLARVQTDLFRLHGVEEAGVKSARTLEAGPVEDPEAPVAEGVLVQLARGDVAAARQRFGAHTETPQGLRLSFAEAELLRAEGALSKAAERLQRVLRGSREAPGMLLASASLAYDDGHVGYARRHLARGRTVAPDHRGIQLLSALIDARGGQVSEEAKALARDVLAADADAASPAEMAQAHALLAHAALLAKAPGEARSHAQDGLKAHPRSLAAAEVRALALLAEDDPEADAAFLEAHALRPTSRQVTLDAATRLTGAGHLAGAERLLEAHAATFRGVTVEGKDGKTTPALEVDSRYWLTRGELLVAQGKGAEALVALDRTIGLRGREQAQALWVKGLVLLEQEDPARAREVLAQVTPEDGSGPLPGAYRTMGELLFAAKDWQRGAMHYGFALGGLLNRGAPHREAEALRQEVAERLRASHQPRLAQAWLAETEALLKPPTDS